MANREYSQEEVDAILERALATQSKKAAGLSHEDLVSAAGEVGIPKEAIDSAAREIVARAAKPPSEDAEIVRVWKKRAWRGFGRHLVPYVLVNVMLAFINITSGDPFLWFLIVVLGWGVGLALHFFGVLWADEERVVERELRRREKRASQQRWKTRGKDFERAVDQGVKALLEVASRAAEASEPTKTKTRVDALGVRIEDPPSPAGEEEGEEDEEPRKNRARGR